jgi:pimeloyl-ACP methyl ester carboxylesterase
MNPSNTRTSTLKVPGARIHHEVRGTGPLLLMIPGGPTDAGVFTDLAAQLADRYTCLTYDPRGNSRSPFDGAPEQLRIEVQADDAARLIEAVGGGPAFVFGTSGGAHVGLDLATRHPQRVRVLVAHEPPCVQLLADPTEVLKADQDILETYRREGVEAATAKFLGLAGLSDEPLGEGAPPQPDLPPEAIETFARINGNMAHFFEHGLLPHSLYRPDVPTLRAGKPRVLVGIGQQSAGQPIADMSLALARQLGTDPISFPGDHGGYGEHAEAFAGILDRAFRAAVA